MWHQGPTGKEWIAKHPELGSWLGSLDSERTKESYVHGLYLFSKGVGKTPTEPLQMRRKSKGWDVEQLLEGFIESGQFQDERTRERGIVKVNKLGVDRQVDLRGGSQQDKEKRKP